MKTLALTLFGNCQVLLHGREPRFRTKKAQALLIYLSAESKAHLRDHLIELLWPRMPESSARQNLRQTLFNLRKVIPERVAAKNGERDAEVLLLKTNRKTVQLNPLADVGVDVSQFMGFLHNGQVHNHVDLLTCHQCRHDLEQAVALYTGDFLADFYLDDSREFEEWAEVLRHTYRRKVLDALETLTTINLRQQNYPQARQYAERQQEIDDLRESAYRQLMEILALEGQREEALATYERCRGLLADELGMAPTKRTTEIYNKIVAGDLRFDAPEKQGVRGYELKEAIGEGAYGTIYRAVQPIIGRDVAVKVIRRKYANDPEFIRRFEAEAQTIARLEHPYIVPLHDYWRDPEGAFLVMRLFRGGSLLDSLKDGPWNGEQTLKMVEQIGSALAAAHRQGIVHRDIKPANILFDETGNAYLSDFGIAKDTQQTHQLTDEAQLVGTPDYISPEQLRNEGVTAQSDMYSLGAVLYETLTGERPFADSPFALRIQKHLQEPLPFISHSRPGLPAQLDEVVQRATAKRPSDRYVDVLAMTEAFRRAVHGEATAVTLTPTAVPADVDISNPYKGLRAFQESDAADFYGRESLTQQLVACLEESNFLAVVGPSGSGKSSLVKAGLIPALRHEAISGSDKWFVAEMVPGSHPLEELELALLPIAVNPPPSLVEPMQKDSRGLLRTIRRILPDEEEATLLLVIDQFEELFTLVEADGRRQHFLNSLIEALNAPRTPLRVVITLRADFYDRPLQIQPLANLVKENTEIILPLSQEELTWAIQEPARQMGVSLEPGVVTAMVADVADQPGALPLLQYALTELFDERQDNVMTQAAYEALGGVSGALALRAEELYASFEPAGQEATRQLFLRLVTLGEGVSDMNMSQDTRRRVRQSEVEGLSVIGDQYVDNRLPITAHRSPISAYGRYRLLTFDQDPTTREPTIEVAHEALLREWPRLRRWLADSRDDVRLQRQLALAAAEWVEANKENGFLLRGGRLDMFAEWKESSSLALTQTEQEFLRVSLKAREVREMAEKERQRRELKTAQELAETQSRAASRLRRLAFGLTIFLLLALGATGVAFDQNQEAQAQADLAATNEAIANSNANDAIRESNERATAEANAMHQQLEAENAHVTAVAAEATAVHERQIANEQTDVALTAVAIAEQERDLTRSRELALAAFINLERDPELSLLLAVEALNTAHTKEAEEVLHQAIQSSHVRQTFVGHTGLVRDLAYSPDGTRLVSASVDGTAKVWNVVTGAELLSFENHAGRVLSVAVAPSGNWVVTGGEDGNVRLWDIMTGEEQRLFPDFFGENEIGQLAISPDGTLLATPSLSNTVKIWNISTGQILQTIQTPVQVELVEFSSDGRLLAGSGFWSDGVWLWQTDTGEELLFIPDLDGSLGMDLSPDGKLLSTVNYDDDETIIWDVEASLLTGEPQEKLRFANDTILLGKFSPDGQRLVVMNEIYDINSGELLQTLASEAVNRYSGLFSYPIFSPDGQTIAHSTTDGVINISNVAPSGNPELFAIQAHDDGRVYGLDISADETQMVTGGDDGYVHLWDLTTRHLLMTMKGQHEGGVSTVAFSPDGSKVASGGTFVPEVIVWEAATGEALAILEHDPSTQPDWPFRQGVVQVQFNPVDGRYLASAGADGTARIWEWETGEIVHLFEPHPEGNVVMSAEFSPDGSRLATFTNSPDPLLKMWDTNSGEELFEIAGSENLPARPWTAGYSPDGKILAGGGTFGWVKLWDAATGEELLSLESTTGTTSEIDFTADASRMMTIGTISYMVQIWDAATGAEISRLPLSHRPWRVAFFNNDSQVITSFIEDSFIRAFTLDVEELKEIAESRITRPFTPAECAQYRIAWCIEE